MPSIQEVTAWSLDEIQEELQKALPKEWKTERGEDEGHLWIRILRPEGDGWVLEWDNFHFDEKVLLLDAFYWLWFRTQPRPAEGTSVWSRRRGELNQRTVTQRVLASVPDPEDLDPLEVQAVYDEAAKKRRL